MVTLGIETSGLEGSIALLRDQNCLAEIRLNQVGRRHAQSLVLEIGDLLRTHDLKPRDVKAVAVSRGPGSFTGLRVGMVCAKTLAYATGCQFISIDTFAAIAENQSAAVSKVFVVEDAQRDDLFVGEYQRDEFNRWQHISPIRIVSIAEFLRVRTGADIVTGPGMRKLKAASPNWSSDISVCQPRASVIAMLGYRQLTTPGIDLPATDLDFWKASPFYLRQSAAEEKLATLGAAVSSEPKSPQP